jgi:hypothetical protein
MVGWCGRGGCRWCGSRSGGVDGWYYCAAGGGERVEFPFELEFTLWDVSKEKDEGIRLENGYVPRRGVCISDVFSASLLR